MREMGWKGERNWGGRVIEMWVGGELEKWRRETDEIGSGKSRKRGRYERIRGGGKDKERQKASNGSRFTLE